MALENYKDGKIIYIYITIKMGGCEGSEVLIAVCLRETGILPVVRIMAYGL